MGLAQVHRSSPFGPTILLYYFFFASYWLLLSFSSSVSPSPPPSFFRSCFRSLPPTGFAPTFKSLVVTCYWYSIAIYLFGNCSLFSFWIVFLISISFCDRMGICIWCEGKAIWLSSIRLFFLLPFGYTTANLFLFASSLLQGHSRVHYFCRQCLRLEHPREFWRLPSLGFMLLYLSF